MKTKTEVQRRDAETQRLSRRQPFSGIERLFFRWLARHDWGQFVHPILPVLWSCKMADLAAAAKLFNVTRRALGFAIIKKEAVACEGPDGTSRPFAEVRILKSMMFAHEMGLPEDEVVLLEIRLTPTALSDAEYSTVTEAIKNGEAPQRSLIRVRRYASRRGPS